VYISNSKPSSLSFSAFGTFEAVIGTIAEKPVGYIKPIKGRGDKDYRLSGIG
jgi:hypothetical protein